MSDAALTGVKRDIVQLGCAGAQVSQAASASTEVTHAGSAGVTRRAGARAGNVPEEAWGSGADSAMARAGANGKVQPEKAGAPSGVTGTASDFV